MNAPAGFFRVEPRNLLLGEAAETSVGLARRAPEKRGLIVLLVGVGLLAWVFLTRTIWGRYLFALGNNEEAARLSGINTDRMVTLS